MNAKPKEPPASIRSKGDTIVCDGDWTLSRVGILEHAILLLSKKLPDSFTVDANGIQDMDTAGAILFHNFLNNIRKLGKKASIIGVDTKVQSLLDLVSNENIDASKVKKRPRIVNALHYVGEAAVHKGHECMEFLGFVGQTTTTFFSSFRKLLGFDWRGVLKTIEDTGYQALGIVALLSFLIGIVIAYQIAAQLQTYGANIYVVDLTGIIILREFGPLITAIIAAGRTSTAFTAQIGTMKVNEELDALKTMGISPIRRLVTPKLLGLVIALPLLSVWADVFGVLGSMIMSQSMLGVNYMAYIDRFQHVIEAKHYLIGIVKAPVFAVLIAFVGCYQGFQVQQNANSVGQKTTKSAVQSIFLIIIADAAFSVLFSWKGL